MRPKIFLNSIPKAGAHLAEKALGLLGYERGTNSIGSATVFGRQQLVKSLLRRPLFTADVVVVGIEVAAPVRGAWIERRLGRVGEGRYLRGHVRYSEHFARLLERHGFRSLHVVRDPRDVVVSHTHYIMAKRRHPFHRHYRALDGWAERLAWSIRGGYIPGAGYLDSIAERYRAMEPWRRHPATTTVRFEDLVGPPGGGTLEGQTEALEHLCRLLDIDPSEEIAERFRASLFGGTSTFRRGQAGSWREAFGEANLRLFEEIAGDLPASWGY